MGGNLLGGVERGEGREGKTPPGRVRHESRAIAVEERG